MGIEFGAKNLYKAYGVPALDLTFADKKSLVDRISGNNLITFTRSSIGTYVGADGLIKSAAVNEPRFDHNPVTGESLGLLIEEARANNVLYSEQFDNADWIKINATVTANQATAPDGTLTMDELTDNATSGTHYCVQSFTSSVSNFTISAYVKYKNISWVYLNYFTYGCAFNIQTGVVGTPTANATSPSIISVGNGVYRISVNITNYVGVDGIYLGLSTGDSIMTSYVGTGSSAFIWGLQAEAGSYPTSYIPTAGSTVTRAADVCTVTNSNIYDTDGFTIINQPFGASAGGSTLTFFDGPQPIKRATVYSTDFGQATINKVARKTDEFWRWRVLGSSFALPNFLTDGQVTVDWGDGTIETLTTAEHTFSNGGGYHDIGFRLNSGTYFSPYIDNNASHDTKVVALGPAPESMKLNAVRAFYGCSNLEAFDATVDATGGTNFISAWESCTSLTSFPLINTAAGTIFTYAWYGCTSLTSFPLINTAAGTIFTYAWYGCSSLTSFPEINTAAGTNFAGAWRGCTSLTDFPANFFDSWTGTPANSCFVNAWDNCSALTATSVENILNSIDTSGQSAPASGVDITIDYNASSGTPSVATAITNLKSRGWTITLNGVLQ